MVEILIKLADVPNFAKDEYHPTQIKIYSEFTKLTFQALNLTSIQDFIKELANTLNLKHVKVRVMRLPSKKDKIMLTRNLRFVGEQLKGRVGPNLLIDIFPDLLWPNRLSSPYFSIAPRGFILNNTIRALIHEMLHLSGIIDENEVRKLTDEYYKVFRRKYLIYFDNEIKPLLKNWKKIESELGL